MAAIRYFLLVMCIPTILSLQYLVVFPPTWKNCSGDKFEMLLSTPIQTARVQIITSRTSKMVRVSKEKGLRFRLDDSEQCIGQYRKKERKAVMIQSGEPVTVQGHVGVFYGYDSEGYTSVPVDEGSTVFKVVSYTVNDQDHPADIFVAALQDDTNVTFAFPNDSSVNVTLPSLGTYGINSTEDITDTSITANRPIAVYSGNLWAAIPLESKRGSRLISGIPPSSYSGQQYIIPVIGGRDPTIGHVIRVLFSGTKASVKFDRNINASGNGEFQAIENKASSVNCTKDYFIYLFMKGGDVERPRKNSDSFMMRIIPAKHFALRLTWLTPKRATIRDKFNHYVSIIAPARYTSGVVLDGLRLVGTTWSQVDKSEFSTTFFNITAGAHIVEHKNKNVKLAAYAYGHGTRFHVGYGFPATGYAVPGSWGHWSCWQPCSVTCGVGVRERNRTCSTWKFEVGHCHGQERERKSCNISACPVPGNQGSTTTTTTTTIIYLCVLISILSIAFFVASACCYYKKRQLNKYLADPEPLLMRDVLSDTDHHYEKVQPDQKDLNSDERI